MWTTKTQNSISFVQSIWQNHLYSPYWGLSNFLLYFFTIWLSFESSLFSVSKHYIIFQIFTTTIYVSAKLFRLKFCYCYKHPLFSLIPKYLVSMTSHVMHYLNIFQVRQLHFSAMHLRPQINLSSIATRNILFSAISCISAPYAVRTLNIRELAHYERDVISALISERTKWLETIRSEIANSLTHLT